MQVLTYGFVCATALGAARRARMVSVHPEAIQNEHARLVRPLRMRSEIAYARTPRQGVASACEDPQAIKAVLCTSKDASDVSRADERVYTPMQTRRYTTHSRQRPPQRARSVSSSRLGLLSALSGRAGVRKVHLVRRTGGGAGARPTAAPSPQTAAVTLTWHVAGTAGWRNPAGGTPAGRQVNAQHAAGRQLLGSRGSPPRGWIQTERAAPRGYVSLAPHEISR